MKRLAFWFAGLPLAFVIIALSVANRAPVTFSLDPVSTGEPVLKITLPLFVLLFGAGFVGLVVGWTVAFSGQLHWRREARHRQREADDWRRKVAKAEQAGKPEPSNALVRAS